jgi:ABC-type sugar transport system ATPase subunit
VRGISKSYPGVRALTDIALTVMPGEVHALVGENGAGKSTLIKILSGVVRPDRGDVLVDGKPMTFGSTAYSEAKGIVAIHQESTAFAHLDAIDNIFVGKEIKRFGGLLLDKAKMRSQAEGLMKRLGEPIDLDRPLLEMTLAQRQMVGIARALARKSRVLIMDEPTASLSAKETDVLFRIIRQLSADGVAVLYISHRLDEVMALASRVTVLRDGCNVATCDIADTDRESLVRMMVGRELLPPEELAPAELGQVMLETVGLTREGEYRDVSLKVRAGEVVGLGGLVGAGRSEIATTIFGMTAPDSGLVLVAGRKVRQNSLEAAARAGIAFVPEDRQHFGLVLQMGIGENLVLVVLKRLLHFVLRDKRAEYGQADELMTRLGVRAPNASVAALTLSGGNQQKLAIGKWIAEKPKVLILDEPTRGVDVGAKADVYKLIRELARQGVATLLISSDLPELLTLSDRIVVLREGRISGELSRSDASEEAVLKLALPDQPLATVSEDKQP